MSESNVRESSSCLEFCRYYFSPCLMVLLKDLQKFGCSYSFLDYSVFLNFKIVILTLYCLFTDTKMLHKLNFLVKVSVTAKIIFVSTVFSDARPMLSLSYRNQSVDMQCKSVSWFLYDG